MDNSYDAYNMFLSSTGKEVDIGFILSAENKEQAKSLLDSYLNNPKYISDPTYKQQVNELIAALRVSIYADIISIDVSPNVKVNNSLQGPINLMSLVIGKDASNNLVEILQKYTDGKIAQITNLQGLAALLTSLQTLANTKNLTGFDLVARQLNKNVSSFISLLQLLNDLSNDKNASDELKAEFTKIQSFTKAALKQTLKIPENALPDPAIYRQAILNNLPSEYVNSPDIDALLELLSPEGYLAGEKLDAVRTFLDVLSIKKANNLLDSDLDQAKKDYAEIRESIRSSTSQITDKIGDQYLKTFGMYLLVLDRFYQIFIRETYSDEPIFTTLHKSLADNNIGKTSRINNLAKLLEVLLPQVIARVGSQSLDFLTQQSYNNLKQLGVIPSTHAQTTFNPNGLNILDPNLFLLVQNNIGAALVGTQLISNTTRYKAATLDKLPLQDNLEESELTKLKSLKAVKDNAYSFIAAIGQLEAPANSVQGLISKYEDFLLLLKASNVLDSSVIEPKAQAAFSGQLSEEDLAQVFNKLNEIEQAAKSNSLHLSSDISNNLVLTIRTLQRTLLFKHIKNIGVNNSSGITFLSSEALIANLDDLEKLKGSPDQVKATKDVYIDLILELLKHNVSKELITILANNFEIPLTIIKDSIADYAKSTQEKIEKLNIPVEMDMLFAIANKKPLTHDDLLNLDKAFKAVQGLNLNFRLLDINLVEELKVIIQDPGELDNIGVSDLLLLHNRYNADFDNLSLLQKWQYQVGIMKVLTTLAPPKKEINETSQKVKDSLDIVELYNSLGKAAPLAIINKQFDLRTSWLENATSEPFIPGIYYWDYSEISVQKTSDLQNLANQANEDLSKINNMLLDEEIDETASVYLKDHIIKAFVRPINDFFINYQYPATFNDLTKKIFKYQILQRFVSNNLLEDINIKQLKDELLAAKVSEFLLSVSGSEELVNQLFPDEKPETLKQLNSILLGKNYNLVGKGLSIDHSLHVMKLINDMSQNFTTHLSSPNLPQYSYFDNALRLLDLDLQSLNEIANSITNELKNNILLAIQDSKLDTETKEVVKIIVGQNRPELLASGVFNKLSYKQQKLLSSLPNFNFIPKVNGARRVTEAVKASAKNLFNKIKPK